ncbi:MAG TPA: tetratricopeptide repeat protein [Verrucomicrobiae bacterium]|jgi:tetratricopeptide (TPR) repeat protein
MGRRKKTRQAGNAAPSRTPVTATVERLSNRKRRGFRLVAVVLTPLLFLGVLEVSLRLFGFGHPTSFLLPAKANGRSVWIQNDRFGWRFFGRNRAREPHSIFLAREKPASTIRVFVFGESAAYGDPQPAFGLPRLLEAMLKLRYPGTRFEVVNAAMTGINSHAVREIANGCAKAEGDIWVIYMGNNEVVGPFGAGTVFSRQTPSLGFIRGSLALKTTRLGQLLDVAAERLHPRPSSQSEWYGMAMFLDQSVRADDPRMGRVYDHFQRNLADIIARGRSAGAEVVVSTVPVNLKDCGPFASAHDPALTKEQIAQWREAYERGIRAQESGRVDEAIRAFDEAARQDETMAELHFRRGGCALNLGETNGAQRDFVRARDLDTLRFRCDRRMNDIIRATAARTGATLADAENVFAKQSAGGLPGHELFYEHVHSTWEGNYLLAREMAERVSGLLPASVTNHALAAKSWPPEGDCARALGWTDRNRHEALSLIVGRLQDPPFTHQLDHAAQLARLTAQLEKLSAALQPAGLADARAIVEAAAAQSPGDAILQEQLTEVRKLSGDMEGAAQAARRVTELLPLCRTGWATFGEALAQTGRDSEAASALAAALRLDADNVWTLNNLARLHLRMGQTNDALREFRRIIALKPRFGFAHLGVGEILEQQGRVAEAEKHFRLALQNRIYRPEELTTLGRFCLRKGWFGEAVTNIQDALKLNPGEISLHTALAQALNGLGRKAEADEHLATAARLDPSQLRARYLLGLELGRAGKPAEAAVQFREVVRLQPDLAEGRLNLGLALAQQGFNREALEQFEEALRLSPTNKLAVEQVQALRALAMETKKNPVK